MNQSPETRKQQILKYLQDRPGEWVDGTELATAEVGGSEGLRRLRDLRADGYFIKQRRHPDKERAIWQYRLAGPDEIRENPSPLRADAPGNANRPMNVEVSQPQRLTFGAHSVCRVCKGSGTKDGKTCPLCEGRGFVLAHTAQPPQDERA